MLKAEVSHELKQALLVAQQYVDEAFDKDGHIQDYVMMAGPMPKRKPVQYVEKVGDNQLINFESGSGLVGVVGDMHGNIVTIPHDLTTEPINSPVSNTSQANKKVLKGSQDGGKYANTDNTIEPNTSLNKRSEGPASENNGKKGHY